MSKKKVLIASPIHPVLDEGLANAGYELVYEEQITQALAERLIADCTGVITSTRLHIDRQLIDAAPGLRWIGRMGSGMEVIDVPYAEGRGIACYSSPEGNCNAVAEHALGMLLSLSKRIGRSHEEVKSGKWVRDGNRGIELEGKTIGIIGLGNTGSAFAQKLSGWGMRVLAYDKYRQDEFAAPAIRCVGLQTIFEEADIVSFHVPLQDDTLHYFNAAFLSGMRKPFILINTSRGKVADTRAILKGLQTGKITGACLDVLEEEPPAQMSPEVKAAFDEMIGMPEVIITPHIAGYSYEALYKMSRILLDRIVIPA